jgi:hypothetical protein
MPCSITPGCGCSLVADDVSLTASTLEEVDCNSNTSTDDVLYAVNLAILQSFYDLANTTLYGKLLTPSGGLQQVQPINLPFIGEDVE